MNITTSKSIVYPTAQASNSIAPKAAASEQAPAAVFDSFTPSLDIKSGLIFGGLGVLPLVGAASNFGAGLEAQFNGSESAGAAGGIGVLSNLAGTATLVGGAIFSSSTAMNIGLGMLGISGLTAAYAGAH